MELSPGQTSAVDKVAEWLKGGSASFQNKPFFYVAGYAGTGKTTIARKLTETAGKCLFATYTGKAASVLQKKGIEASTIHSLVYKPLKVNEEKLKTLYAKKKEAKGPELSEIQNKIREELKPKFVLNDNSALLEADLLVVDEVSMVGEEMGRDLLTFQVPILVLGDPGQLPPLSGEGFFTRGEPDVMLTEIHRQAAGNPIISLATLARQGNRLKVGVWGDSRVLWKNQLNENSLAEIDQVICGRNATRKATNSRIRDILGKIVACPEKEEKIICLKNNKEAGILNGTQWRVQESCDNGIYFTLELKPDGEAEAKSIIIDSHPFDADFDNMPWWDRKKFEEFDFGYAITCHKSQGSQWPTVLIQDESWIFKENKAKWLYTALTRAESKVMVVL